MDDLFPDTYRGHGNLGVGENRRQFDYLDNREWALRFGRCHERNATLVFRCDALAAVARYPGGDGCHVTCADRNVLCIRKPERVSREL